MKQQQKGYTKVNQAQKKEERKERARPKDNSNTKTTKELLGQLYRDKEYLEKLFDSKIGNISLSCCEYFVNKFFFNEMCALALLILFSFGIRLIILTDANGANLKMRSQSAKGPNYILN